MGELEPFLVKINSGLASKDRVFLDKGQNKKFWFPYMFKHEKYTKMFYLDVYISFIGLENSKTLADIYLLFRPQGSSPEGLKL